MRGLIALAMVLAAPVGGPMGAGASASAPVAGAAQTASCRCKAGAISATWSATAPPMAGW